MGGPDAVTGQATTTMEPAAAAAPGEAVPPANAMLPCQVCGRGPTAMISVSRNVGLVMLRRYWRFRGPLCRDHAMQLAGNWLLATLLMGWWGVLSFFMNFGAVITDLRALLTARSLAPAGSVIVPGSFANPNAAPMPIVAPRQLGIAGLIVAVAFAAIAIDLTFGPKQAADLVAGDCFDEPSAAGEIDQVPHHPCSQPHTAEVFAVLTYASSTGYPTDDAFQAFAQGQCGPLFDTYTGGGTTGLAATVDLNFFAPTSDAWAHGNHSVICYLVAPVGQTLSQSLRASH